MLLVLNILIATIISNAKKNQTLFYVMEHKRKGGLIDGFKTLIWFLSSTCVLMDL